MKQLLKRWLLLGNTYKCWIFIALLFNFTCYSQVINYVGNGGFEEETTPPSSFPKYWTSIDSAKYFGVWIKSPSGVPSNSFGYQWSRSGKNYIITTPFCTTCSNNKRGFPKNRLKKTLEAGKGYCVTLYVSLSNQSTYGIDRIGAFFGDSSIDTITQCNKPIIYLTPQVENSVNNIIVDTLNWIKVQGSFIANGTEKYMLVGNFYSDANTHSVVTNTVNLPAVASEYFLDDISVIEENLIADAGPNRSLEHGDSTFIGYTPDVGIDEACIWYKMTGPTTSVTIDTIAGLWVKPITTTTYVVRQEICGNVKWDTVVIFENPLGVNERLKIINEELQIYPTPVSNYFEMNIGNQFLINDFKKLKIYNAIGQMINEQEIVFDSGKATVNTSSLENGIYLINLVNSNNEIVTKKLVITK
jgi:hypothetical protein